ncbi:hypothetical protein ADUPG1_000309 [Aduncisulcus paluster]|uniref:Uncharacterized protein n=1 Tax=Aduncisulcus paluster TaxID=2918883 RepID=A0ABQ5K7R4_9EUKA|nr:hypothetical protein ADUPG1_000309 [Aduncisulcus paluster]
MYRTPFSQLKPIEIPIFSIPVSIELFSSAPREEMDYMEFSYASRHEKVKFIDYTTKKYNSALLFHQDIKDSSFSVDELGAHTCSSSLSKSSISKHIKPKKYDFSVIGTFLVESEDSSFKRPVSDLSGENFHSLRQKLVKKHSTINRK